MEETSRSVWCQREESKCFAVWIISGIPLVPKSQRRVPPSGVNVSNTAIPSFAGLPGRAEADTHHLNTPGRIWGIGDIEILNGTPGVGSINTRAVCKMIVLPYLLANDVICALVPVVRVYIT